MLQFVRNETFRFGGCEMRKLSNDRKEAIYSFIDQFYDDNGYTPSVHEIGKGTGIPTTSVHRYLKAMKETGDLVYEGRKSIETFRTKKEGRSCAIPVLGRVSCGPGDYEFENILEYIRMPESWIGKGDFFALIAKGNSMIDVGINDGDYIIVRKQNTARTGDLVVALYDDGLNNLKKLCYDDILQKNYLYSCNPDQSTYAPIYVDELEVQGVAVCNVHNLLQI